jgi:hypothetical protein
MKTHKVCTKCGIEKPVADFYKRKDRNYAPINHCKECVLSHRRGNPAYAAACKRNWLKNLERNRKRNRDRNRRLKFVAYGTTEEGYKTLFFQQEGMCAICGSSPKPHLNGDPRFHVDHDHATLEIRGLLCSRCNLGLGYFSDDPSLLVKAIEYLAKNCSETAA